MRCDIMGLISHDTVVNLEMSRAVAKSVVQISKKGFLNNNSRIWELSFDSKQIRWQNFVWLEEKRSFLQEKERPRQKYKNDLSKMKL